MLNRLCRLYYAGPSFGGLEIDANAAVTVDNDGRILLLAAPEGVLHRFEEDREFGHGRFPAHYTSRIMGYSSQYAIAESA